MKNITFDSTNFSDQLGIYDFFNLIISGATFVCGICIINANIATYLFNDLSFMKSIGLLLFVYIIGMILQEIGSIADKKIFNTYTGFNRSVLKGELDKKYKNETTNKIIKNPLVLERYRQTADKLLQDFILEDEQRFDNEYVNGYVFSVCQYYVAINGKDKKVEKLRALFAMSKTLIVCFFILSAIAFFSIFIKTEPYLNIYEILGVSNFTCDKCINKIIICIIYAAMGGFFVYRSKRVMRNFLLILLGTYDAIVRSEENFRTTDATK